MPWLLILLAGCPTVTKDDDTGEDEPATCDDLLADLAAEEAAIRACDEAAACGTVLTGTSCGCTHDAVARLDADTTRFYELQGAADAAMCDLGEGTCDCPEAYGYACEANVCTWNYADSSSGLPDCRTADGAAFDLTAASVSGDILTATVAYSGGCEGHDFVLCWPDGTFQESAPVQVQLELWHDANGDDCDAYPSEDRTFDLTPVKAAWQAAYAGTSGTILVHIGGQEATYTFGE